MLKFFFWMGVVAAVLLFVSTAILAWFNWNQKVSSPILSIMLGGTVTVLLTLVTVLKEETVDRRFTTSVVFDTSTASAGVVSEDLGVGAAAKRFIDFSEIARTDTPRPGPSSDDEVFAYASELLQYYMLRLLVDLQRDGWVTATYGGSVAAGVSQAPKLTYGTLLAGPELLAAAKLNRFANRNLQRALLEHSRFMMPRGTTLVFDQRGQSCAIVLRRPSFFDVRLTIEPMGMFTAIPTVLNGIKTDVSAWRTVVFRVEAVAHFDKWTAGNWQTEEHKRWIQWLLDGVDSRLAERQ